MKYGHFSYRPAIIRAYFEDASDLIWIEINNSNEVVATNPTGYFSQSLVVKGTLTVGDGATLESEGRVWLTPHRLLSVVDRALIQPRFLPATHRTL